MAANSDAVIGRMGQVLNDPTKALKLRFRALFSLRSLAGPAAICEIGRCFDDPSALLKHELAYCLGQMQDRQAIPILVNVLDDLDGQEDIVRHEAGEALGAIGSDEALEALERHLKDRSVEVSQTCQLSMRKINWLNDANSKDESLSRNPYNSIDPTPPCAAPVDIPKLELVLLDRDLALWDRYRAMFSLRNDGCDNAVRALGKALHCSSGALFRHEVAYVLGQVQSNVAENDLVERLSDQKELGMVRHECAEALGAIGTERAQQVLQFFLKDSEILVRESCEVALDVADSAEQFQYALVT